MSCITNFTFLLSDGNPTFLTLTKTVWILAFNMCRDYKGLSYVILQFELKSWMLNQISFPVLNSITDGKLVQLLPVSLFPFSSGTQFLLNRLTCPRPVTSKFSSVHLLLSSPWPLL